MNPEVARMVAMFMNILHTYSIIEKKPRDYGIGIKLTLSEVQIITQIGDNPGVNLTQLADITCVTRGAISQMIVKLAGKKLVVKDQTKNNKEFNLNLSETGKTVYLNSQEIRREVFTFAQSLYSAATPHDREMVKRLFGAIQENLKERINT
ncbi:MAG: hypothetical protein A2X22_09460 [Bacteroidetes bacterium GWF2_49_14]|nr:MAG: hypothetical protein A2X22_09460 [Bacteroidetes bacterium GWF2_49_14]